MLRIQNRTSGRLHRAALLLAVAGVAAGCSGRSTETSREATEVASEARARLVYYAIPGCQYCAKVTAIVNGLEQEYDGALDCEVLDAMTPEGQAAIKGYGFGNHGMVVFDQEGNLRSSIDGHLMEEAAIRAAVSAVLDGTAPDPG